MSAVLTVVAAPLPTQASERDADIALAVRRYANRIGCTPSNTQAAIAWALKSCAHTLQAVREGRRRAEQLRQRQVEESA